MSERDLNYHAARIANWKRDMMPPEKNTLRGEFDRSLEEVTELDKEIVVFDGSPESKERVGGEAVDVIFRMLAITGLTGIDVAEALDKKITDTVQTKYPATLIKGYQAMGIDWDSSMALAKRQYQNRPGRNV